MRKVVLVILGVVIIGLIAGSAVLLLSIRKATSANVIVHKGVMLANRQYPTISYTPTPLAVSPSPITSSSSVPLVPFINPSLSILWQSKKANEHDYYTPSYKVEKISGIEQDGETTYKNPSLHELANVVYLQANGWTEDMQIAADGPMGSEWGYSRTIKIKSRWSYFLIQISHLLLRQLKQHVHVHFLYQFFSVIHFSFSGLTTVRIFRTLQS